MISGWLVRDLGGIEHNEVVSSLYIEEKNSDDADDADDSDWLSCPAASSRIRSEKPEKAWMMDSLEITLSLSLQRKYSLSEIGDWVTNWFGREYFQDNGILFDGSWRR